MATYSVLIFQKFQVSHLVASEAVDDLILGQKVGNRRSRLLIAAQLGDNLFSLLDVLGGGLLNTMELAVHVCDVIRHVGVLEKRNLAR